MKRLFPFLLVVLIGQVCTPPEKQRIEHLLVQREEAFREKNLALYLSCISRDYQDKEEDFEKLKMRVNGYFATFDRIHYRTWDRSIEIEDRTAKVVQKFRIEVEKGGKKSEYTGTEIFFLRKEPGGWRIIRGL